MRWSGAGADDAGAGLLEASAIVVHSRWSRSARAGS